MFLPLKDTNPLKVIPFQAVTFAIIALCVAVFLWQASMTENQEWDAILSYGSIPAVLFDYKHLPPEIAVIPAEVAIFTAMFMHADWLHLGGNMLYLWVFGDNIEDSMGHVRFVFFYFACGVIATLTHSIVAPESISPLIGASGAISGVLGAYLLLHPKVRVLALVLYRVPIPLPAYIVLGGWIVLQFFNVWTAGGNADEGGTAWWAHIGGFIAGVLLIIPMRRKDVPLFDKGRD